MKYGLFRAGAGHGPKHTRAAMPVILRPVSILVLGRLRHQAINLVQLVKTWGTPPWGQIVITLANEPSRERWIYSTESVWPVCKAPLFCGLHRCTFLSFLPDESFLIVPSLRWSSLLYNLEFFHLSFKYHGMFDLTLRFFFLRERKCFLKAQNFKSSFIIFFFNEQNLKHSIEAIVKFEHSK